MKGAVMTKQHTTAIILAAGSGTRMKSDVTKQFMLINGTSVLDRSIAAFDSAETVDEIIVVARECEIESVLESCKANKPIRVVAGGKNRAESARNGFNALSPATRFVAIHDAARCLILPSEIDLVVSKAYLVGAAFAASHVIDTIKKIDSDNRIIETVPRDVLVAAQTPQVFDVDIYKRSLVDTPLSLENLTDDNMLVESIGISPVFVEVSRNNIKITTPDDVEYAEFILKKREEV